MIDIETLGRAPDGVIASIGAVAFEKNGGTRELGPSFYTNIDLRGQKGRVFHADTVCWWLTRSQEAQVALRDPKPTTLEWALHELATFITKNGQGEVWANGVTFDLAILRHAYGYPPWSYKQELCMRPIRVLGKSLGLDWSTFVGVGVHHNALDDAMNQARYVQQVFQRALAGPTGSGQCPA